ncbi:beta-1,3-glucan-binding protein-like [Phlebotomus argentipes]|uniref:beta-1,3-glucan-binding protein-like n=1 Tax=Phlebotomus argentipes TaxID=94469 RepID=UPI00289304DB|nr:beta-1,3-glucan-binding protein-like [Phlebotomus argentipes]
MKVLLLLVAAIFACGAEAQICNVSATIVSGTHAPQGTICSGQLLFEENFNELNFAKWQHEITLAGGGNWEFQWYSNNRSNSYVNGGLLYIRPTLTNDTTGDHFISSGTLNIHGGAPADQCTNPQFWGCERTGSFNNVINPIKSARIRTVNSFAFRYGRVEVQAKLPAGDWLWPAIWLMPKHNVYGSWPASGEIDLMEARGNRNLLQNGVNIGVERVGSTLHFGPYPALNGANTTHFTRNSAAGNGFNRAFHRYQLEWTPDSMRFYVDGQLIGTVNASTTSFWDRGGFAARAPGTENPWRYAGRMAPFDQEFYLIINLAVGGTNFFPDNVSNPGGKPWHNSSPQASTDFWNGRNQWLPTWNLRTDFSREASLQVDYVRIWAL